MQRPSNYNTRHGEALISYLKARPGSFVTAAQLEEHFSRRGESISRPTIYRQLEKLAARGLVRKYLLGGTSVASFQYADPDEDGSDSFRLKCRVCQGVFSIECGHASELSGHIKTAHEFQVDDTVFYGTCKSCTEKI